MNNNPIDPGDFPFMSPEEEIAIEGTAVVGHGEMVTNQLLEKYEQLLELQKTRPQDVPPSALEALNEKLQEHVEWMRPYGLVPEDKGPGAH